MTDQKFIVIGDGIAGATAAENIKNENGEAEVKVLTEESEPLYNRIMLKTVMKGDLPAEYTRVHNKEWYEKRNIDLLLDTRVEDILEKEKKVKTGEEEFNYDKLVIATGGSPRTLPFDNGCENVHYMWTMSDAENIKESAEEAEKAVVIGGGLLGIDLAVAYAEHDCETHYLIREDNWWSRGLDETGASIIHSRLEDKGVKIVTNTSCVDFTIEDGNVVCAKTDSGEKIDCDAVAVAIGQTPNSGIVGVEKNDYDMIMTDETLQTSDSDIYAAGNLVEYDSPIFERRVINGAWDHSEAMGETAGKNAAGKEEDFDYVNTYGVGHFDVQFLSIGDVVGDKIQKKYNDDQYLRLVFREDRLVGGTMIGYTKPKNKLIELIENKETFKEKEKLLEKDFWN